MNLDVLHAWMEGHHVGVFERRDGTTSFEYDPGFEPPISLSLPRQGGWNRRTPGVFLENLLPDNPDTREIMAQATHAKSTDTFDLLDKADVTGGLVFSREDTPPHATDDNMIIATDEAIAARIVTVRKSTGSWWDSGTKVRFSLAGNQPKFTLGRKDGIWYWSDYVHPSTHILKPSDGRNPHVEEIEAASMHLSALCGISTPRCGILSFENQKTYVVERFDRVTAAGDHIIRVHTEDMMQALGLPPGNKYSVKAKQILAKLHSADESDVMSYQWVERLALNTSIGNVDAHAKNYSIVFRPDGVCLSPMYDVLTTTYWPHVDKSLPMEIGGVRGAKQLTPHHWRKLAVDNNLDPDKVEETARNMAWLVLENADEAYRELPREVSSVLKQRLEEANLRIEPVKPEQTVQEPVFYSSPNSGGTYVRAHSRGNAPYVSDYWR